MSTSTSSQQIAGMIAEYLRTQLRQLTPSDPAFAMIAQSVIDFESLADGRTR